MMPVSDSQAGDDMDLLIQTSRPQQRADGKRVAQPRSAMIPHKPAKTAPPALAT